MPATAERKPHPSRKADGPLSVAERNAVVEAWLARWPRPVAFLTHLRPGLKRAANELGYDDDELDAACLLAGVEAARRFEPDRGVFFHTFAAWHMVAGVQRLLRVDRRDCARRGGRRLVRLDAAVRRDEEVTLHGLVAAAGGQTAGATAAERADLAAAVWRVVCRRVPSRQWRGVVERLWGLNGREPHTFVQVGKVFGFSRGRAHQIEVAVIAACREEFAELHHAHQDAAR